MRTSTRHTEDNPMLNPEKLERAILYFLQHPMIEYLGTTKLMKLLYFADFDHYEQYERPITGARYRRLADGPVPDEAMAAITEMERSGRIIRRDVVAEGVRLHRYSPTETVDFGLFSVEERAALDHVAARWAAHTTKQIAAATRGEAPWFAVRDDEVIPYYLAHYRNNFGGMTLESDELSDHLEVPDEDEVFAR
jgi:uncharacterized phage-associated protein